MAITMADIRALREKTQAPIGDCKTALEATGGDLEKAVDELRKKGLSVMVKRSDKEADQGLIAAYAEGKAGTLVEVCAETDFVARNEMFQGFVDELVKAAHANAVSSRDDLLSMSFRGVTVQDVLADLVGTIRENISLGRVQRLDVSSGCVGAYIHDKASSFGGRIGVLVALESSSESEEVAGFAKKLCMHVAANKPTFCFETDMDAESVSREKALAEEKARASGKPDNIVEKIVEGRMRAFAEATVFVKQNFLFDTSMSVEKAVEALGGSVGGSVTLVGFQSFAIKGS